MPSDALDNLARIGLHRAGHILGHGDDAGKAALKRRLDEAGASCVLVPDQQAGVV